MKILMLVPAPALRGPVARHSPLLVEALRELGGSVETEIWGRHADADSTAVRAVTRLRDVARIRRRLRRERFDLMVVKTSHETVSLVRDLPLLAAARRSVPHTVVQFHGGETQRLSGSGARAFKAATAALLRLSDGVLVLSSEEQRLLAAFRPRARVHVVANPFVPAAMRDVPPARADEPATVLFASRLIREKGIFDVLEAIALVRERTPCRLLVAGAGPAAGDIADRVDGLGLAETVTLAGFLSGGELARAYADADLFVLPTYWPEGFPTAISEAMGAGLPVVATRTRGIADHLEDGVNAVFVPPRDPRALAAAIANVLEDGDLRERMGHANLERVREFAPDRVGRQYLGALEAIVERH